MKKSQIATSLALGVSLIGASAISSLMAMADTPSHKLFQINEVSSSLLIAEGEKADKGKKAACGAGSCGSKSKKGKSAKCGSAKCGKDKGKDKGHKCGSAKCGKGKDKGHKCGSAKCGKDKGKGAAPKAPEAKGAN